MWCTTSIPRLISYLLWVWTCWGLYLFIQCIFLCILTDIYSIYLWILSICRYLILLGSFLCFVLFLCCGHLTESRDKSKNQWKLNWETRMGWCSFFMKLHLRKLRIKVAKHFQMSNDFVYLCIIKQIVYESVRDSVISVALTVIFIHQWEALCCFVFLHILEKTDIDVWL